MVKAGEGMGSAYHIISYHIRKTERILEMGKMGWIYDGVLDLCGVLGSLSRIGGVRGGRGVYIL